MSKCVDGRQLKRGPTIITWWNSSEIVAQRLNAKDYWKNSTYFEAVSETLIYCHNQENSGDYTSWGITKEHFRHWLEA